ncbi:MAG: hypothetical protein ACLSHW_00185 [Lachnospiraceae bacterium]
MRQKILKQVGVLLTVSILLTFLVVSLTMYSKFNGYMHDSVREEAEYIRVAIEETEGDYLNEKISSLKSDNRITLLNTDGTVLYDSLEDASAMGNHGNRPEVKEAEKKAPVRCCDIRKHWTNRPFTTLSCWRTEKFSGCQEASILFLGICSQGLHWWLFWCWQSSVSRFS